MKIKRWWRQIKSNLQNNQMENEKEYTKMALNEEAKSKEENNSVKSSAIVGCAKELREIM